MNKNKYAGRIKELREKNAWTQEHLAKVANLSVRTVQRVERGDGPSVETLAAIASAFGVGVTSLIDRQLRIYGAKEQGAPSIHRIKSGRDLLAIAADCEAFCPYNDEFDDDNQIHEVAAFLSVVHDYGDIWQGFDPGERVRFEHDLSARIARLEGLGISVFAGITQQILEGGGKTAPWRVLLLAVIESCNSDLLLGVTTRQ